MCFEYYVPVLWLPPDLNLMLEAETLEKAGVESSEDRSSIEKSLHFLFLQYFYPHLALWRHLVFQAFCFLQPVPAGLSLSPLLSTSNPAAVFEKEAEKKKKWSNKW